MAVIVDSVKSTLGAVTNGYSKNSDGATNPLNIAIVGAGIGGLTAAIGLRRNGHTVTLFEQSRFANETGAAIHLAPNCNGILRRYGIFAENFGAVSMTNLAEYNEKGDLVREMDLSKANQMWQHPWQLAHRVRLHDALKQVATSDKLPGTPAVLKTSSKVLGVDAENATITLENGEKFKADMVLGADGIYSKTRAVVSGHESKLFSSGKAAFRFLISREAAEADPLTAKFCKNNGELALWYAADRRVVMYPCNDNKLLNFVCIHPEEESQGSSDQWNKDASLDSILRVYRDFSPGVLALFKKADPTSLKVWKLLDMEVLPTWTKAKLALLGDAAHPFLPHQGQGGGVAIEDAATIAVVLPLGTNPEEIPERLKLYEQIRYDRANKIQEFSRQAGKDWVDGKPQVDIQSYTVYNFGHDEWHNSSQIFKKWQRAKNPNIYWRSPIFFGPVPGPRQDVWGKPHPAEHQTFVTASIKFKTSRTFLQNLFPTDSFSFKSPGTVAFASFSATTLDKMAWLGGGGYNHFGLYIHGVQYKKKDGTTVDGSFLALLFENLADPIVSGRDELGMPKIFCELDIYRREKSYRLQASWRGAKFADFTLEDLVQGDVASATGSTSGEADHGNLAYRYIPAVGEPGKADVEYAVVVPHAEEAKTGKTAIKSVKTTKKASISFDRQDWDALPTLHHIADVLADIPIYDVVEGKVVEGTGVPDVRSARRIE